MQLIVNKECFDVDNYLSFFQGPLPVANFTRTMLPSPLITTTRMAPLATPLHESLIKLAISAPPHF